MNLVRGKRLSSRLDTALFRIEEGRRLLGFDALTDDSNRPERNPTQDLKGAAAVANLRCGTSAIAHGAIGLERRGWVDSGRKDAESVQLLADSQCLIVVQCCNHSY